MTKPIPRIIFYVPLGLAVAMVIGWFILQWAVRGPLAGDIRHDFGTVAIPADGPAVLNHTFELANRKNQPLTVNWAKPNCACLKVNAAFPIAVGPRQRLDLPTTMEYRGADPAGKTVLITLDCGKAGQQSLLVKARPAKAAP